MAMRVFLTHQFSSIKRYHLRLQSQEWMLNIRVVVLHPGYFVLDSVNRRTSLLCNTALCLAGLMLFPELFCIAPPAFCRFHFNISCCSHFYPWIGLMRRSCQGCDEAFPVYFGLVPGSPRQTRMHNQRLQVNVHFQGCHAPINTKFPVFSLSFPCALAIFPVFFCRQKT